MSWAARRRALYLSILGGVVLVVLAFILVPVFYRPPTCSDGVQNSDERGVDCGGSCARFCAFEVSPPSVSFARTLPVARGVYNVIAYVLNPNVGASADRVPYSVRVFDEENVLIAERKGETFLTANSVNPIFEPSIVAGERTPARTFFEFTGEPVWERSVLSAQPFAVRSLVITDERSSPRLTAEVENLLAERLDSVEVVATLFDADGNALATSRTVVESLGKHETVPVVFTWPEPFARPVARIDVMPRARAGN